MPNPPKAIHRMNIGLPLEVYEALQGYSEFIGKPPATVAADLLKDMYPTMDKVSKALQKAKKDKNKGIDDLRMIVLQEIAQVAKEVSNADPEQQADLFKTKEE